MSLYEVLVGVEYRYFGLNRLLEFITYEWNRNVIICIDKKDFSVHVQKSTDVVDESSYYYYGAIELRDGMIEYLRVKEL